MERSRLIELIAEPARLIPAIRQEWTSNFNPMKYRQWSPANHDVFDKTRRRDKTVREPVDYDDPNGATRATTVEVSRIGVPIQKLIVRRMTAFIAGGSLSLQSKAKGGPEERILSGVNTTWSKGKVDFRNGELVRALLSETEAAEIWFTRTDGAGKVKLRCKKYSPADGYELVPVFDATGDMVAFGLGYKVKDDSSKDQPRFDVYTDEAIIRYAQVTGTGWTVLATVPLPYGKIPVVYYQIQEPIWSDVQTMIDRFETVISNFCDTNDYNGSPILFAKGVIEGFANKGETGKVIQGDPDAELGYVTWAQVPEAIKFEVELLLRMIYSGVQVPDISFEAMRALGALSGVAFDRLMIDAHLRAKEFQDGVYGEGVQRRINFLVSAVSAIPEANREEESLLDITPKFGLFSINDDSERIANALAATGGKPIMTQREGVAYVGIADDPDETADELEAEAEAARLKKADVALLS